MINSIKNLLIIICGIIFISLISYSQVQIPYTRQIPVLDGDMEEIWNDAAIEFIDNYIDEPHPTSSDFTGEFRMLWNENNLYLFISINDNVIYTPNYNAWWSNDAVALCFDGGNEKSTVYDINDVYLAYIYNDDNLSYVNDNQVPLLTLDDFSNCHFVSKQRTDGYNFEIDLPATDISTHLGIILEPDTEFGMDIVFYDRDASDDGSVISWRSNSPDWWESPDLWGTAKLIGIPPDLIAITEDATDITYNTAILHGSVNPDGLTMNAYFEYGDTQDYGESIDADQSPVAGTTTANVSTTISGLYVGATYHYRVALSNGVYTRYGEDRTFTTISYPFQIDLNHTTDFPNKPKGSDYQPSDYRLVGLPGASNILIEELCSGIQDQDWQIYWDNGEESNFLIEYNDSDIFRCVPGRAFWVLNKGALQINLQDVSTASLNNDGEAIITLHSRWNLITNPFHTPIEWVKVKEINQLNMDIPIWSFDGSFHSDNLLLEPYEGYYFDNNINLASLIIPFEPATEGLEKQLINTGSLWKISITLICGEIIDESCYFAVNEKARVGLDSFEYCKPRATGLIPEIYFYRHKWDPAYPFFANDVRPPFHDMKKWDFEVQTPSLDKSTLSFTGMEEIPQEFSVYLIDHANATYVNLRQQDSYDFTPINQVSSFSVIVGKDNLVKENFAQFLPKEFSLNQNYPNPFNPTTSISFYIPVNTHIMINIFNVEGKLVRTLLNKTVDAGMHQLSWDGKDNKELKVSSGLYIYQMKTGTGKHFNRKMILIK